jgi:hypothetical protein
LKNSRLLTIFFIVFIVLLGVAPLLGRLLAGLAPAPSANAFIIGLLFFSRIRMEAKVEGGRA